MEKETIAEATENPTTEAGDTDGEQEKVRVPEKLEGKPEKVGSEQDKVKSREEDVVNYAEIDGEGADELKEEHLEGEHIQSEYVKGIDGEYVEGEHFEGEYVDGEQISREDVEEEHKNNELGDGEELAGEHVDGEHMEGEQEESEKQEGQIPTEEEKVEEEERYVEEPPPDPAAPYNFSDSKEFLREPFELRPDQLMEVELLWAEFQNYTPAYTDLDNYITEKELVYMLKALLLMTYTPEQLVELIEYCVKPPHPEGHITYEQFLKMVIMRQRDFPIEEELRSALQVYDPDKTGLVDREYLKEMLSKHGHKMPQRQLDNLIKEVDLSNDGTIGIEDIVGTMCIDLNKEDIQMLRDALNPNVAASSQDEVDIM